MILHNRLCIVLPYGVDGIRKYLDGESLRAGNCIFPSFIFRTRLPSSPVLSGRQSPFALSQILSGAQRCSRLPPGAVPNLPS